MSMIAYMIQHNRYLNIVGIGVILLIAFLFSKNRRAINYRLVSVGLIMQAMIGFLVLKTSVGQQAVGVVAQAVKKLYEYADVGIRFMFGNLVDPSGSWGFIFAFKVLPVIVFFGAFMGLLFHFGIVQRVVRAINYIIQPLLATSGAETLCAIANSFLGQTEAPLLIRHYLKEMTKSEMLVVMVSGMATISGAILVVFAAMGVPAGHLLAASVMAIPASIVISKILLPETEKAKTDVKAEVELTSPTTNLFDAVSGGTSDGMYLALNVGAMLISFLALLALLNACIAWSGGVINHGLDSVGIAFQLPELSVATIFAYLFAPFGYLLGFTGNEALAAGQLIGTKVAVNELIAYGQLTSMPVSDRFMNILTYALCGFSNFSCIGIQIGGIGALVPEKRKWLTQLGMYAVLGGALANLLSAMLAGLLL